ncbi:hypothetical protein ACN24M_39380 [Streptomyces microflavus]|uniref:hypothetical protein n=1 Tax=Streptomyces microflavus TaxID=1919 RepID=UPI003B21EA71
MSKKPVGREAVLYGEALDAAFQPVRASRAALQYELAGAAYVSQATASRYLNGINVAPEGFVDALAAFVSRHGHPLAPGAREELHRLRKKAEAASTTEAKLSRAREEVKQLKNQLVAFEKTARASQSAAVQEALEGMQAHTAQRLAELDEKLEKLSEELAQEKRLRKAERDRLQRELREKDKLLADAGELVRSMNADMERREEEAELQEQKLQQLHGEVKVLRGQLARLLEEKSVPDGSMELNSVVASQSAENTATVSPGTGTTRASRSAPQKKPGTRPVQVPAPRSQTAVTPAPQDKRRGRLIWPLEPLFATINMLASVGAPSSSS